MNAPIARNLLAALAASALACGGSGGGSDPPPNDAGPTAIVNGSTLATATSHWQSVSGCHDVSDATSGGDVRVELATNGAVKWVVRWVDSYTSYTTTCTGTWTATGNGASALLTSGSCTSLADINGQSISCHARLSGLINIAGSTGSAGFASGVNSLADGYSSDCYGGPYSSSLCVFNLVGGAL